MVVVVARSLKPQIVKIHRWTDILSNLREILKATELKEEAKWGVPCYTYYGKNILILSAFNDYCAVSFLKELY